MRTSLLFAMVLMAGLCPNSRAQENIRKPWTLEVAVQSLRHHPADPYQQFVAIQLFRAAGEKEKAKHKEELQKLLAVRRANRSADLLSFFSGAHAIQESLQLDTLIPGSGLTLEE